MSLLTGHGETTNNPVLGHTSIAPRVATSKLIFCTIPTLNPPQRLAHRKVLGGYGCGGDKFKSSLLRHCRFEPPRRCTAGVDRMHPNLTHHPALVGRGKGEIGTGKLCISNKILGERTDPIKSQRLYYTRRLSPVGADLQKNLIPSKKSRSHIEVAGSAGFKAQRYAKTPPILLTGVALSSLIRLFRVKLFQPCLTVWNDNTAKIFRDYLKQTVTVVQFASNSQKYIVELRGSLTAIGYCNSLTEDPGMKATINRDLEIRTKTLAGLVDLQTSYASRDTALTRKALIQN
jgi:hypothetical protein